MGTFNGERHLQEQLDSLAAQTHTDWSLWVSDDGSTDRTLDLVQAFARRFSPGKVQCIQGPRLGFAANFMSLLARPDLRGNYFAFCDQDDVWLPHRLAVTLEALASVHPHSPALACGRTEYMDEHGQPTSNYGGRYFDQVFGSTLPGPTGWWPSTGSSSTSRTSPLTR